MIFLLDNYDSFTFNLYDYLAQSGNEIVVERNNRITVSQIADMHPEAIVISPGPGVPRQSGILMELIEHFHNKLPILGICLGYQAIGEFFGAGLIRSKVPVHGKTSDITFDIAEPLFQGIEQPTAVMRYHSLNIQNIPETLKIIAVTESGEPMALRHRYYPLCGFQFHPESILTKHGLKMLTNWQAAYLREYRVS